VSGDLTRLAAALADRYRLERELGAGGMATVYLAHDLKHDRQVAIKVLRPELAAVIGAERFLSEIRTTANLQHPHILPLFDSGATHLGHPERSEGSGGIGTEFLFYVMPLVEGESLRDRLQREKQLPIADAVRIATEVAGALDYAHRHGVIHRDIKPENILLHDGRALVADFGIALAASKAGGTRLTETGMSLGTPAYMSPEQAMGEREITARSDVYALGCVTYEMLVGEPPFTGPTAQAVVSKVMTAPAPSPAASRGKVPPGVEAAVLTALEKLPADRFATAAEFAAALSGEGTMARRPSGPALAAGSGRRSLARLAAFGGLALAGIATAFFFGRRLGRAEAPSLPPARLALLAPQLGAPNTSTTGRQVALTPSGDAVVYVGTLDSTSSLFLQRLDAPGPVEIVGSASLRDPAITLDGKSIIGLSPAGGFRLPLEGGTPRAIPLPSTTFTGAWAPDGSYWFSNVDVSGLVRLTPTDSAIPLDTSLVKQRGLRVQQVLADGHSLLVVRASSATAIGPGMLFDLRTGELTPLLEGPVMELRSVRGELLSALPSGSITAAPFDERNHRILGPAVEVATGVSVNGNGLAEFAVAENGTLAYIQAGPESLILADRNGRAEVVLADQPFLHAPQFSPDGRRVSFDITTTEGRDVWILSLDQRSRSRATFDKDGHDATWTPDGRFITYTSFLRNGSRLQTIYRTRPGSTSPPESLFASAQLSYTGTWLRDGSGLITDANNMRGSSGGDLARIANAGRGPLEPLLDSPYLERYALPSPDGRLLAFASNQSGREEIYVRPLSGDGDVVQVSRDGGSEPVWAPDGRELFYRGLGNGRIVLIAAALRTTPDLAVASQRVLFPIPDIVGTGPHANYDISPDGRTFAMSRQSPSRHIVVIQNLPELLRRLRGAARTTQ
jgi:serine/threonine-protein kinase